MQERVTVSDDAIRSCVTFRDVLHLCFAVSGKGMAEVAFDCHVALNVLSRILRPTAEGDDVRHMPGGALVPFMVSCGNVAPLRWLMFQLDCAPSVDVPVATLLDTEVLDLRRRVQHLEESMLTRNDLLFMLRNLQTRGAKPMQLARARTRLMLRDAFDVPGWLSDEALRLECAMMMKEAA